ncbi:antibiotic biosynthesis monooxygenase [Bacillus sp. DNRA2]|uniref:antibiotic biosynthesis monooxygenase family protein n=1 Tax=Bacillus sp. DNRA2 TaxID=2723053 RepID=UPI00145D528C|nr:antibiotic biosynthesis monooxygenase [Bacillus sp. DNRA2]NMD72052.1 antibiotic biosynthesis monooxygenase [Bacillus sp. DNRA2]
MKVYMTGGTYDYLSKIKSNHPNETMQLMVFEDQALLLHETDGETIFKEPRNYEVLDSVGMFSKARFIMMNNIPVADEGRALFEHRFKNRNRSIEKMPGFVGIRVLRPLSSDTYVIVTLWEDESAFEGWKKSEAFGKAHGKPATSGTEGSSPKKIFSGSSFVTKYFVPENTES